METMYIARAGVQPSLSKLEEPPSGGAQSPFNRLYAGLVYS